MSRFHIVLLAAIPILGSNGAMAATSPSATGSSSVVNATLSVVGFGSETLPDQLPVTYTAPPTGKATPVIKKNFSASHSYFGGEIVLTAKAKTAKDTAQGGVASGATTAKGTSTISTPTLKVDAHGETILTGTAASIVSSATVSKPKTGTPTTSASVTITGLTLSSQMFGLNIKNLTVSPKPNQILAKNKAGTAKIIGNRQVTVRKAGKVTGVVVNALDVQLTNFVYGPYTLSGDIVIANSTAK